MSFMAHLHRILPIGDELPDKWSAFAAAERECIAAGYAVALSPDSRIVSVDLERGGGLVAEAKISLVALEEMPEDVRDWALTQMLLGLLGCAEDRRNLRTVSRKGETDIDSRREP